MTDSNDLTARVALRALAGGYGIRPTHIGSLAGHIRMTLAHRDVITDADIDSMFPQLAKSHRSHFVTDPAMTAEAKLELANERLAKRGEATRPSGTIELTEKERARLEKMTPDQRNDLANIKTASALAAAQKKKKGL